MKYLTFPQICISVSHTVNESSDIQDRDLRFWNKQATKEPGFGILFTLYKLYNFKQSPAPSSFSCLIWILEITFVAPLASRILSKIKTKMKRISYQQIHSFNGVGFWLKMEWSVVPPQIWRDHGTRTVGPAQKIKLKEPWLVACRWTSSQRWLFLLE